MKRLNLLLLAAFAIPAYQAAAQVVIVDDDFESYADDTALDAVWDITGTTGTLVDETFTEFLTLDDLEPQDVGARAFPEGGQGVLHQGGTVVEYTGDLNGGSPLLPTESQNIVLQGDVFSVGNIGNARLTIGLRSASPAENLIELGHYNTEFSELAYRAVLFPGSDDPNWQFFDLPLEYDTSEDGETTLGDLGEAWHTYRATIGTDSITFELDIFSDGLNASGEPGFDVTVVEPVATGPNGYTSLRMGGPSDLSSPGNGVYSAVIFDNLSLSLVDIGEALLGDADGDGDVDGDDLIAVQTNFGSTTPPPGDADGDGDVDGDDLIAVQTNFGATGGGAIVASAPEPASAMLFAALAGFALVGRGRAGAR